MSKLSLDQAWAIVDSARMEGPRRDEAGLRTSRAAPSAA
jgi:hypothetical protein